MKKLMCLGLLVFLVVGCGLLPGGEEAAEERVRLNEDYEGAVSVSAQLMMGTLALQETDLAIDEGLAGELVPLWQAYQSLAQSDTAAAAETGAVINQIQDMMSDEQVLAIAEMMITQESGQELLAGLTPAGADGEGGAGRLGGAGFGGGAPGGGPPGGGAPGGGGRPGGAGPGADLSPEARETAIAERFGGEDPFTVLADRVLVGAVIRTLQITAGIEVDVPAGARGGQGAVFGSAIEVVSAETGLSVADIRIALGEGQTLAEIVEANGGDIEAVKVQLVEELEGSETLAGQDVMQLVDDVLMGNLGRGE